MLLLAAGGATWQFLSCIKFRVVLMLQWHGQERLKGDYRLLFGRIVEHVERIERPLHSVARESESIPCYWPQLYCNLRRLFCGKTNMAN